MNNASLAFCSLYTHTHTPCLRCLSLFKIRNSPSLWFTWPVRPTRAYTTLYTVGLAAWEGKRAVRISIRDASIRCPSTVEKEKEKRERIMQQDKRVKCHIETVRPCSAAAEPRRADAPPSLSSSSSSGFPFLRPRDPLYNKVPTFS